MTKDALCRNLKFEAANSVRTARRTEERTCHSLYLAGEAQRACSTATVLPRQAPLWTLCLIQRALSLLSLSLSLSLVCVCVWELCVCVLVCVCVVRLFFE